MTEAKLHIKQIVARYKKLFPLEYAAATDGIKMSRELAANEYGAMADGGKIGAHFVERALFEVPETLNTMFMQELSTQEIVDWKTDKTHKLAHWFCREFPEFSLARKI